MQAQRTLVYFGLVPSQGNGSGIVVYRHLKRFAEDGWRICIVSDWGQEHLWSLSRSHGWSIRTLSLRKLWWPPFNPNHRLTRALRAWLWGGEVSEWLGDAGPIGVLTNLSAFGDTLSIAAAGFARRYRLPLATIVHDDVRSFTNNLAEAQSAHARSQWVVGRSSKAWFATPELADCFDLPSGVSGVLPPIPGGSDVGASFALPEHRTTASELSSEPLLVYAGYCWPAQIRMLGTLSAAARGVGGRLLAVVNHPPENTDDFQRLGIERRAPFERNVDALSYFKSQATAMVVSYCEHSDDMPWIRTSFPSKLIEYSHLNLPLVIVAPADTAVVRWARRCGFPDVFEPGDIEGFANYVIRLKDPAFNESRRQMAIEFSRTEFCPKRIQNMLASTFA